MVTVDKPTEIRFLLERADQLSDQSQHEEAAGLYARICQEKPDNIASWLGLAKACLQLRRYSECLHAVSEILALDSQQLQPYLIATAALNRMARYAEAIRAAETALAISPNDPRALNGKADALLGQKRYVEVLPLIKLILEFEPDNAGAHLNQGIALHGLGQSLAALEAFDRLLALAPNHPNALINRSSTLIALDRAEEALQSADAALRIRPDATIALLNRTAALLKLRRSQEALATADRLLKIEPRHIKGLINKTIALLALQDYQIALTTIFTALTFDSFNPDALELKLQALLGLRRFAEVVADGQRLVAKYPGRIAPKLALAKALVGLKRFAEAESHVDAVLISFSNQPDAVSLKAKILSSRNEANVGRMLVERALVEHPDQGQLWAIKSAFLLANASYLDALVAAERALALDPDEIQAAINRIAALNGLQRFAEGLASVQKLIEHGAKDWQLYANLGGALAGLGRFEEAERAFATARDLDPEAFLAFRWRHEVYGVPADALMPELDARSEYLALQLGQLEQGNWDGYDAKFEQARMLIEQCLAEGRPTPIPPFKSLLLPFSPKLRAAIASSRGMFLASGMSAIPENLAFDHPTLPATGRLKIGYVSADFRDHPTAHLMRSLFRVHDRQHFEIYVYSLGREDRSDYYRTIRADADRFASLVGASNAEAAKRINADGIHILIDLMGYTSYARTEIFALKPAPVQASYLGYPGTMGASFLPYIIADMVVLPEGLLPYFTEHPVYLPECYQVNDRWQEIADTGVRRSDQGLPETGFVFCCFNQIQKLEPVIFSVWMRILHRIPGSVLWLYAESEEVRERLRTAAGTHGIARERLIFAGRLPKAQHLERHRLADLFLDTRLYNAHTTASDALWAGLPVLTCLGETFPARVAASLLQSVGLPELITHSLEEYEELAVRLATTPTELTELQVKLSDNRLRMPLFDTERFARHLERAYQLMWERHVRGLPPGPIRVAPLPGSL